MLFVVAEYERRSPFDASLALQDRKVIVKGQLPKCDDNPHVGQQLDFLFDVSPARENLRWRGLVARRSAADRGSDIHIAKRKAVVLVNAVRLRCKSLFVKRLVEEVPRTVASEHAACSIPAMSGRSKADNQNARMGISETRHRPAPIVPIAICPPFVARDVFTILHQPRAQSAVYNLLLENFELQQLMLTRTGDGGPHIVQRFRHSDLHRVDEERDELRVAPA